MTALYVIGLFTLNFVLAIFFNGIATRVKSGAISFAVDLWIFSTILAIPVCLFYLVYVVLK